MHRDLAVFTHRPVELHDVELAVLPALEEVIVDDETRTIPVVVPERWRDVFGPELPQFERLRSIECDGAVEVVPAAGVKDGEAVGIDRDRALDDVADREVRQD